MNRVTSNIKIFIDPPFEEFNKNVFFNKESVYNRDNSLSPYSYLKNILNQTGFEVYTADYLLNGNKKGGLNIYFSLGNYNNYKKLLKRKDVILHSFFIYEPPVVCPFVYKDINFISKSFKKVFVFDTNYINKKYSKKINNLKKFYYPQAEDNVMDLWNNKNRKFLTLINGNKKPRNNNNELYSERIKAVKFFSKLNKIDLYGFGWNKYIFYLPYILNRKIIIDSYKGSIKSKLETLSQYDFSICFENMILSGYITEKIFDCFLVGTIPIYLGAPDIENYVSKNCFIDMRDFKNYDKLLEYIDTLREEDIIRYRENAKRYLNSKQFKPFTKECFANTVLKAIKEEVQFYNSGN